MERETIEEIHRIEIRMRELRSLDPDILAAVSIASFAATESSVFMRLYIDSSHPLTGRYEVDLMVLIQCQTILRAWSAKIFEFWDFIERKQKYNKTRCLDLINEIDVARQSYAHLQDTLGYRVAMNLRNEATNHYSLDAARKNLRCVSDDADVSMLLHQYIGNTCYLMGEEVMVIGRMNRQNQIKDKLTLAEMINAWNEWNRGVTELIVAFHYNLFKKFIHPLINCRGTETIQLSVPCEMVCDWGKPRAPIFFRELPTK